MFSPHADLHTKAAYLAIEHTAYFFDQIRMQFGDNEFGKFFELEISNETFNDPKEICIGTQKAPLIYLVYLSSIYCIINLLV